MTQSTATVAACSVLNKNHETSIIEDSNIINNEDHKSFIVSDVDSELLILIEFAKVTKLKNLRLIAFARSNILPSNDDQGNDDDTKNDDNDILSPDIAYIYKTKNLNVNFDDIESIKPDKSVKLIPIKINKGQIIKLNNNVKFKYVKYLIIHLKSTQKDKEIYLNGISFNYQKISYKFNDKDIENMKILTDLATELNEHKTMNNGVDSQYLFSSPHGDENSNCKLTECKSLQNINNILKQYHLYIRNRHLNENENEDGNEGKKDQSVKPDISHHRNNDNVICNDIDLLNDYNHLLLHHTNKFEDIYNILIKKCNNGLSCNLSYCLMMRRNHRDRQQNIGDGMHRLYFTNNDVDIIKQQWLDRIHCYFFHTFDNGYKLTRKEREYIQNQEIKSNDDVQSTIDTLFDSNVATMYNLMQAKKSKNPMKLRNNKFVLEIEEYSYGYRFFYWPWYKNNTDVCDPAHPLFQTNSISITWLAQTKAGSVNPANNESTLSDWYIEKKYNNLKEELIQNAICAMRVDQVNREVKKAQQQIQTRRGKSFQCERDNESAALYELKQKELIQIGHLVAMMVYCNFDILQCCFTATYRYKNKDESPKQLKIRHSNYYWMGRLLRECVECFGEIKFTTKLYHGVNKVFRFSSMFAFINGPLSTTKNYSVAVGFSENTGMIVQLDMNADEWRLKGSNQRITFFDCQWISDYSNESEIFCIGGMSKFRLNNIIQADKGINYSTYIRGILQLAYCMTSSVGDWFYDIDTNGNNMNIPKSMDERQIVFRLLSHQLNKHDPLHRHSHIFENCPDYIVDTMQVHLNSMKTFWFMNGMRDSKVHKAIFTYDNGWIKIDLIMKMCPNVEYIYCDIRDKDMEFMKINSTDIIKSVLYYIRGTPETILKCIEIACNPKYSEKDVLNYIIGYKNEFRKIGWNIYLEYIEHAGNVSNRVKFAVGQLDWKRVNVIIGKLVDTNHMLIKPRHMLHSDK